MATRLWIVHRDARWRSALARAAGRSEWVAADPLDARAFEGAERPDGVLLGLAGDFEAELEFAHRHGERLGGAVWVLLAEPSACGEARRLFDALAAPVVPLSGDAAELGQRLRAALARRPGAPLSERSRRDAIRERFGRWFRDLDPGELLEAADPRRSDVALLVRGEPGTGRGLLVRYLHLAAGGAAPGPLLAIPCGAVADPQELEEALEREGPRLAGARRASVCLEDVDRLSPSLQRRVRDWIEYGLTGRPAAGRVRWLATAGDDGEDRLAPELADALAGLALRLPPLRERPEAIARFASETAEAWCRSRGEPVRSLGEEALRALRAHPWPGNLRELEAVVVRTLAAVRSDPIAAAELRLALEPAVAPSGVDEAPEPAAREEADAPAAAPSPNREPGASIAPAEALPAGASLRRLARALAHEVGNPLVGIRTFTQMLERHFDDPEFRRQFGERVASDAGRIQEAVDALGQLGGLAEPAPVPVDVSALLAGLLEMRRGRVRERGLVVLEELERDRPEALADPGQLRLAFELILDEALALAAERGDLYVATRRHPGVEPGAGVLRVLLRLHGVGATGADRELSPAENALPIAIAELLVRAQRGSLELEAPAAGETLLVIDLPAAPL